MVLKRIIRQYLNQHLPENIKPGQRLDRKAKKIIQNQNYFRYIPLFKRIKRAHSYLKNAQVYSVNGSQSELLSRFARSSLRLPSEKRDKTNRVHRFARDGSRFARSEKSLLRERPINCQGDENRNQVKYKCKQKILKSKYNAFFKNIHQCGTLIKKLDKSSIHFKTELGKDYFVNNLTCNINKELISSNQWTGLDINYLTWRSNFYKLQTAKYYLYTLNQYKVGFARKHDRRDLSSIYKSQLIERKKLGLLYGNLSKKEIFRTIQSAEKYRGVLRENILRVLESRLDVILYRIGFFKTIPSARQWIIHRKILVNQQVVTIAHYQVKAGDVISVARVKSDILRQVIKRRFSRSSRSETSSLRSLRDPRKEFKSYGSPRIARFAREASDASDAKKREWPFVPNYKVLTQMIQFGALNQLKKILLQARKKIIENKIKQLGLSIEWQRWQRWQRLQIQAKIKKIENEIKQPGLQRWERKKLQKEKQKLLSIKRQIWERERWDQRYKKLLLSIKWQRWERLQRYKKLLLSIKWQRWERLQRYKKLLLRERKRIIYPRSFKNRKKQQTIPTILLDDKKNRYNKQKLHHAYPSYRQRRYQKFVPFQRKRKHNIPFLSRNARSETFKTRKQHSKLKQQKKCLSTWFKTIRQLINLKRIATLTRKEYHKKIRDPLFTYKFLILLKKTAPAFFSDYKKKKRTFCTTKKPLHLEISYQTLTAIYLYSPQKLFFPVILDIDAVKKSYY